MTEPAKVELEGGISLAAKRRVRGWAFRPGQKTAVRLSLRINGKVRSIAIANGRTPNAGRQVKGTPLACGFEFFIGSGPMIKADDEIVVADLRLDTPLPNMPFVVVKKVPAPKPPEVSSDISTVGDKQQVPAPKPEKPAKKEPEKPVRDTRFDPTEEEVEEIRELTAGLERADRRSSLLVFGHAVLAFFLREIRDRFGQSRSAFLWTLLQPIIFMLGLGMLKQLVSAGRSDAYGVSWLYFFWLGIVPFFMFLNGLNRCMGSTSAYRGLYQFRQVQPFDVILVRAVFEFGVMIIVFGILLAGFAWWGNDITADNWLGFAGVVATLFMFTFGCGLIAEVSIALTPDARQVIGVIERPLFFISGIFFTIDHLPPDLRAWLIWNPLLHAVDLARGEMLTQYDSLGSWPYLLLCSVSALAIGLAMYHRHAHRLRAR